MFAASPRLSRTSPILDSTITSKKRQLGGLLLASLAAFLSTSAKADTISLSLAGTSDVDLWGAGSLTAPENSGFPGFPGTNVWPRPIQSPVGGDGYLYKVSNGTAGGGPFPSGSGIYFGGADTTPNTNGGTLGLVDLTPVSGVKTVTLQMQIGQAFGYDLLDNNLSLVKLSYTTSEGTFTLGSQSSNGLLNRFYNGTVDMPTGPGGSLEPQDIYVNLWGFQWDLSGIAEPILSYEIQFTAVQHASLAQLQVDQTNTAYGLASVFPKDFVWNGQGADTNWTTATNWAGGAAPTTGRNVTFTGESAVLDSTQTIGSLTLQGLGEVLLSGANGAVLETASGIKTTSAGEAHYQIDVPVKMNAYNLIEVGANTTLNISGPITGSGFYKQGDGNILVSGNNNYNGTDTAFATNGMIFRGGTNTITGTNAITGGGDINFHIRQQTTVVLKGGNDRLDSKFVVNMPGVGGKLVLGDAETSSNQTLAGLNGAAGSQVVAGGAAGTSTLTINSTGTHVYAGRIGGNGPGENNITVVKNGSGSLTLNGVNTYNGGTNVKGGALLVGADTALGSGPLVISGGAISYSAAFDDLRIFTIGAGGATIDTGIFSVSYAHSISGAERLTKAGVKGILQLTAINEYLGGTTVTGGFLSVDQDRQLGAVPAVATPGNLILNNAGLIASESFTLNPNRGIALGNNLGGSGWVTVAPGKTLGYGGILANAGTTATGLYKLGAGTLALSGVNTYTGTTDIYHGKLLLDFASAATTTNLINSTSNLRVYGGDLEIKGQSTGTTTQNFGPTTTFGAGHSNLKVDSNGGAGTSVALNTASRTLGATVNIDLPASGNVTMTGTSINGVISSLATPSAAYLTVNKSDWGSFSGSNVVPLSTYQTSVTPTDWAATENVSLSASASGVTSRTINTLKLNNGADLSLDSGQALSLATGGLLVTGSGASEISGGSISGSTGSLNSGREFTVFQYNTANPFTISSVVANTTSGATALVKAGEGTLILSGANTYSGVTRINEGTLSFSAHSNLGTSSATTAVNLVIDGGTLQYTGPAANISRSFTIGYNGATIDASGTGALTLSSTSVVGFLGNFQRTLTLTGTNTGDNSFSYSLNDASSGATRVVKDGPGTWMLTTSATSGATNGFTGGVEINGGTLKVGRAGALNSLGVNRVDFGPAANTKLALNGFSITLAGLGSANANPIVENGSPTNATLTINSGSHDLFGGTLQNGTGGGTLGLAKSGSGILELSGTNTYTGATSVMAGQLHVTGALTGSSGVSVSGSGRLEVDGSLANSIPVTIDAGGTLGGEGTLGGITLKAGGTIALDQLSGDLRANSLVWGPESAIQFHLGADSLNLEQLLITGAFSKGIGSGGFTIELVDLGVVPGTTYELIHFGSTDFTAADFAFLTDSPTLQGTFTVDADSVNFYAAVPEPSAAALLLTSVVCLGLRRRRRA